MSCNQQNQTTRVSTITLGNYDNGDVTGQLTRLTGSNDTLLAKPHRGYIFTGWFDDQDNSIESEHQITIPSWSDRVITPKFEALILQKQDFIDKDAMESLVYYLEMHGQSLPVQYYSAGDYSTDSKGTGSRLLTDGTSQHTFPVTYGYNYGPVDWDPDTGAVIANQIGKATHDPDTNTNVGTFYRDPRTYEHKDSVSVPELLKVTPNSVAFPSMWRGYNSKEAPDATTNYYSYWNYPHFSTQTSPADGSAPLQFPFLQYHCSTLILNYYTQDISSFTGLEDANIHHYHHQNAQTLGRYIADIDLMASWKELRYAGTYRYYGYGPTSATKTKNSGVRSPRMYEPFNYMNKLQNLAFHSARDDTTSNDTEDVDVNMSWQSAYRTKPKSGSMFHALRYTPIKTISFTPDHRINDTNSLGIYYKSLRSLRIQQCNTDSTGALFENNIKLNLEYYYAYNNTFGIDSFNFLSEATNLRHFYYYGSNHYPVRDLKAFKNKKINYYDMRYAFSGLIRDKFVNEPVKLHMSFDSQNILTQDSTRYVNKLNNHGAVVTTT